MAGAHENVDIYRCYRRCGVELTAELQCTYDGEKVSIILNEQTKKKNPQLYIQ